MAPRALSLALGLCFVTGRATSEGLEGPNPIRRVSTLLEGMQKKIVEEAKKEEGLHDKFLCHCKKTSKELQASIAKREREIPTLAADLKAAEEQKVQIGGDLTKGKDEREQAHKAIRDATAIREKEAAAFAKDKAEQEKTIAAIVKAVAALREGMGQKSFLQSQQAQQLRAMRELRQLASATGIDEDSRVQLLAFLEGGASYSPQSGEIVGILEQMGEQMRADLKKSIATESASIESLGNLTAAKKKEIKALDDAIESKTQRMGDLAMEIARMKQEMGEGPRLLEEDKRMLNDLTQDCTKGKAEYDCRVKTRAEEQTALSEALHTLTNDDALGTFKKALKPAAPVSFLQVSTGSRARAAAAMMKARALSFVDSLRGKDQAHAVQLNLLAAALQGQGSFDKVVVMIDQFIQTLKTEQKEDDTKKDYCSTKIFEAGQKSSDLSRDLSDKDTGITSARQGLQAVVEDLQGLQASLVKMDKEVAQATDLRKAENADYTSLVAGNNQARDLLSLASKRLRQFYAPKSTAVSFLQEIDIAPVANATNATAVVGACVYQKAHGEAQGVLGLLDQLSHDLEVENLQAKLQEQTAQKGFEKLVADAGEKRTAVTQSLTQRNTAKADLETNLQLLQDGKTATGRELTAHGKVTELLHKDCDFLLAQYSTRQDARSTEIEALRNAKTILLSGDSTTAAVATTTATAAAHTTAAPVTTAAASTVAPTTVVGTTTAAAGTTAAATTVAPTTVADTTTVATTTATAAASTVALTTVADTTTVATTTAAGTTAAATTVAPTTVADTTTVATTTTAVETTTTAAATTVAPTTVADTTTVATTTTAVETTTTATRQQKKKSAPPPTPPSETETVAARAKNTDEGFFFAQLR